MEGCDIVYISRSDCYASGKMVLVIIMTCRWRADWFGFNAVSTGRMCAFGAMLFFMGCAGGLRMPGSSLVHRMVTNLATTATRSSPPSTLAVQAFASVFPIFDGDGVA